MQLINLSLLLGTLVLIGVSAYLLYFRAELGWAIGCICVAYVTGFILKRRTGRV